MLYISKDFKYNITNIVLGGIKMADNFSIADEIKKLKDLLDSGAITQQEYEQQKKELLGPSQAQTKTNPSTPPHSEATASTASQSPVYVAPAKKKKKSGCLIAVIVFIGLLMVIGALSSGESDSATSSSTSSPSSSSSSSAASLEDEDLQAKYREFDDKSWSDFEKMYISHSTFMSWIEAYTDNRVSKLDLYDMCDKMSDDFGQMSVQFNYATNDDEETYLDAFSIAALSEQQAADALKKYLDSGKTSDLSKANEQLERAKDAFMLIAQNRGKLLVLAGLSEDEIAAKVEEDMAALEDEMSLLGL